MKNLTSNIIKEYKSIWIYGKIVPGVFIHRNLLDTKLAPVLKNLSTDNLCYYATRLSPCCLRPVCQHQGSFSLN